MAAAVAAAGLHSGTSVSVVNLFQVLVNSSQVGVSDRIVRPELECLLILIVSTCKIFSRFGNYSQLMGDRITRIEFDRPLVVMSALN